MTNEDKVKKIEETPDGQTLQECYNQHMDHIILTAALMKQRMYDGKKRIAENVERAAYLDDRMEEMYIHLQQEDDPDVYDMSRVGFYAKAMLQYIGQIKTGDEQQNQLLYTFWTHVICSHRQLYAGKKKYYKCCLVAGKNEEFKLFSKKFIFCTIGYLKQHTEFYNFSREHICYLLGETDQKGNCRLQYLTDCYSVYGEYQKQIEYVIDNILKRVR